MNQAFQATPPDLKAVATGDETAALQEALLLLPANELAPIIHLTT
jgi:hypothetical protein